MFPLTDLSILFLTLLIITFFGLGFMVLMGLLIHKKFSGCNHLITPYLINVKDTPQLSNQVKNTSISDSAQLTISDWIAFLSSEKFGAIGTITNFGGILVALIAIVFATKASPFDYIGYGLFAIGLTWIVIGFMLKPFQKRGRLAERILGLVMIKELKTERSIYRFWIKGLYNVVKKHGSNFAVF